ncbi:hypothetical protein KAR52_03010, partial [Candidatus Pacearchaeota archaeon]|nr:hypothetical protein [Candidatus Pacearchaeota archaeon]
MTKTVLIFCTLIVLLAVSVSSAAISQDLHLNIQTTGTTGTVTTGTFAFVFNISTTSDCSNVVYTNSTSLTTDTRGIISYYLPDVTLDFSEEYYLCYYRDGTLINASKIVRTPYTFRAKNVTLSGVEVDMNLNMTEYNVTGVDYGFFNYLGSLVNRITKLFAVDVDVAGDLNVTGNLWVNNINASNWLYNQSSSYDDYNYNQSNWNVSGSYLFPSDLSKNVGIGTSSPGTNLVVDDSGGTTSIQIDKSSSGNTTTDYSSDNTIVWQTGMFGGSNDFQIRDKHYANDYVFTILKTSGSVGIGTATPQQKLNVVGALNVTGTSYLADADFNGGWQNGGFSISGGDIFAQTGYFYNISSLEIAHLSINGSMTPYFDNQFDVGNASLRWKDLYLGGEVFSNGTGNNYFLGNVGIGTDAPYQRLSVSDVDSTIPALGVNGGQFSVKTANVRGLIAGSISGGNYFMQVQRTDGTATAYDLLLQPSGGNVGIGTDSPAQKFNVVGQGNITGNLWVNDINASNWLYNQSSPYDDYNYNQTSNVYWNVSGSYLFPSDLNKNVGIGTVVPAGKLSVSNNGHQGFEIFPNNTANTNLIINYDRTGSVYTNLQTRALSHQFLTGTTARLTINSSGNVGIGTSSPEYKFHVNSISTASETLALFKNDLDATNEYNHIAVGRSATNNNAAIFGYLYDTTPGDETAFVTVWGDNPAAGTGLFVKKGGNVGIGTSSPESILELGVTGSDTPGTTGGIKISRTTDNTLAHMIRLDATNKNLHFDRQDNSDNWYSTMTLERTTGRVGIGDSTPSHKLEVNGNILSDNFDAVGINTSVGVNASYGNTGNEVTTIGFRAGESNSVPYQTAIGVSAGRSNSGRQTAIGYQAGYSNSGSFQTAVGHKAGWDNTKLYQTVIGDGAGYGNTGDAQTAIGYQAGSQNTGQAQIAIGYQAGYSNDGRNLVAIGYQAGKNNQAPDQFILKQANVNAVPLIQGNFSSGHVGIGTSSPSARLEVANSAGSSQLLINSIGGIASLKMVEDGSTNVLIRSDTGDSYINAGNVGIGTSAPATKLDVNGSIKTSRLGTYGTYNSAEVQGIWSISEAFPISTASDNFGTQYGMGYAYSTNGGAPLSGEHQVVFTNNGVIGASIGFAGNSKFGGTMQWKKYYKSTSSPTENTFFDAVQHWVPNTGNTLAVHGQAVNGEFGIKGVSFIGLFRQDSTTIYVSYDTLDQGIDLYTVINDGDATVLATTIEIMSN